MLKLNKYNTWEGQGILVKKGLALTKPINIINTYRPQNMTLLMSFLIS